MGKKVRIPIHIISIQHFTGGLKSAIRNKGTTSGKKENSSCRYHNCFWRRS